MIGLVSCQDNIDVVSYPSQDGNSFICLEERGQVDTLILLPYSAEVLQQSITHDSIVLLIETPRFYEYLLINRSNGGWQVDSVKSGSIFSEMDGFTTENNDVRDPKDRFSLTHSGVVEYLKSDNKTLRIPLRLIQKRDPSWLYEKETQVSQLPPPPPAMPLFQLEFELEIDSLRTNRNKRVNFLRSQMEECCLPDSSLLVIQFIIDPIGELSKFKVVKDMTTDQRLNEKIVSCLEDVINELNLNFGELKSIPSARGQAIKVQHTIPLRGSRKVRSNSRSLQG
ncbi:MAG: hypothetical protein ACJATI_002133 [Halioglobus sp.]|jgi:hypothetical protein